MKKLIVSLTAVVVATSANAIDIGQYVSLGATAVLGGTVMSGDITELTELNINGIHVLVDMKDFFGGHIAYGVKLDNFRIELEGSMYTSANLDLGKVAERLTDRLDIYNRSVFLNGYLDIKTGIVTPYIGAGIGYNNINLQFDADGVELNVDLTKNFEVLAYKLAAGASFKLNKTFAIDAGYRYMYFGEPGFELGAVRDLKVRLAGHEAYLGVRINF